MLARDFSAHSDITSTTAGALMCVTRYIALVDWPVTRIYPHGGVESWITQDVLRRPATIQGEPPDENTLDSSNFSTDSVIPSELPALEDEPTQLLEPETQILPPMSTHAAPSLSR